MTQDDIVKIAWEANLSIRGYYDESGSTPAELMRFASLVASAEREECAKVCEELADRLLDGNWSSAKSHQAAGAEDCAAAIRSRGSK